MSISGPAEGTNLEDIRSDGSFCTDVYGVDLGGGRAAIAVYLVGLRPLCDSLWAEYKFCYQSVRWVERSRASAST